MTRAKLSHMARHPRGMGPLFRRGKGTGNWCFRLDGERIRTPHTDKKDAERWRIQYLANERFGRVAVGADSATVDDILTLVRKDYERTGKASLGSLESRLKRLRANLGSIKLVDLRDSHFEAYVDTREAKPATVNRELEILRRALKLAASQTPPLISYVPRVVMLDESDNVRTQTVDHETYSKICAALPNAERWACVLAYHIGWRLGKILELTWDQVDWERMVILAPAKQREGKMVGTAPIYGEMQAVLSEALRSWENITAQTAESFAGAMPRRLRGSNLTSSTAPTIVIHRPHGTRVVDIRKAWRRATKAAGCPGLRFHDLRACAASNLIDAGVPQVDAMAILGHQTDAMFRRYRLVSAKRLRSIGEQMEAHLEAKKGKEAVQ